MSPKNHLLTRDQISVWYIPSVPGADTGMYFITLWYLLHWLHFIHSCICYINIRYKYKFVSSVVTEVWNIRYKCPD